MGTVRNQIHLAYVDNSFTASDADRVIAAAVKGGVSDDDMVEVLDGTTQLEDQLTVIDSTRSTLAQTQASLAGLKTPEEKAEAQKQISILKRSIATAQKRFDESNDNATTVVSTLSARHAVAVLSNAPSDVRNQAFTHPIDGLPSFSTLDPKALFGDKVQPDGYRYFILVEEPDKAQSKYGYVIGRIAKDGTRTYASKDGISAAPVVEQ